MLKENYKGFEITLSDSDTEKLDKAWSGVAKHWTCTVKDKVNRKQMSFDVFGGSQATMEATQALYHFVNDAYTYAYYSGVDELYNTFGYYDYKEARTAWKKMEKAYYKCRKFIGTDDEIYNIVEDLQEKWA